jgi:peptidoglycan hydrolase CwlO-like protein
MAALLRATCLTIAAIAIGCRAPAAQRETQMPQAESGAQRERENLDKEWDAIMQKVKELEEEIAEMEKGLPPD